MRISMHGRAIEARIISEDLVAREPWNHVNIDRFRRALVMLGESDPDAIIADRLSGESPFLAIEKMDLNEGGQLRHAAAPPRCLAAEHRAAAGSAAEGQGGAGRRVRDRDRSHRHAGRPAGGCAERRGSAAAAFARSGVPRHAR